LRARFMASGSSDAVMRSFSSVPDAAAGCRANLDRRAAGKRQERHEHR
jgi:hypothetical protein